MDVLIFLLIPISSIALLFLRDRDKDRKFIMNALLVVNAMFFMGPVFMAYLSTPNGESMWDDMTGGGAALWLYFIIVPLSTIAQLVLLVLKLVFALPSKIKTL